MDNGNANYSGTVNLPNGGQVTDIANPEANDQTTSSLTAAPQTPPPAQAQTPQGSVPPQQGAPQPTGIQSDAQGQNGAGQQRVNLSKPQQPNTPNGQPAQAPVPAHVQRAANLRDAAIAMTGGPRYTYSVDPATGQMQQTAVQPSGKALALSLALEALSGSLTGLAAGGPQGKGTYQNPGRAGAAAFAQGQQQVQAQDAKARLQAQQDFAQKGQVFEQNMRQWNVARNQGKMDDADNDAWLQSWAPVADTVLKSYSGYVLNPSADYKQLSQYDMSKDTAIPVARVPRIDPATGQRVVDKNGVPMSDFRYMVLSPEWKQAGLVTKDGAATLAKYGINGDAWSNPNIMSSPLTARMALSAMSHATSLQTGERVFDNIFDTVDSQKPNSTTSGPVDLKTGTLTPSKISNPQAAVITDKATDAVAPSVANLISPANFKAVVSAVAQQEDPSGDPKAKSPTGVVGNMQLDAANAKAFGVTDRTDMNQTIPAGTKLIGQLLQKTNGSVPQTLAAYYSGMGSLDKNGNIVDTPQHTKAQTQAYVDQTTARMGLNQQQQAGSVAASHPDPAAAVKAGTLRADDIEQFTGAFSSLNGNQEGMIAPALAHIATQNPDAAARLENFFTSYGNNAIQTHDNIVLAQNEAQKAQVTTDAQEDRLANKQQIADAAKQQEIAQAQSSGLIDQIGKGQIPLTSLSYIAARKPEILEAVSEAYPGFDGSKVASYAKAYQDFTSGKTAVALNAGSTALGHLSELKALNTYESHIPGTPDYVAYHNKSATLAVELAKFYGETTVPAIKKIEDSLNSTLPGTRDAAIRTQAQSMNDKFEAYRQQWANSAPSSAYEANMPGISPAAKAAQAQLDPRYAASQQAQQNITVKTSDGKMGWNGTQWVTLTPGK